MSTAISRGKYAKLLASRLPRVIRSYEEHVKMLADVQELMAKGENLGVEETELLSLMVLVIQDYEKKRFGMDDQNVTSLDMLKHLMEAHDHTAKDLWDVVGDKGTLSKVLNGERMISKSQAKRLGQFYGVSPAVFI